MHFAHAAYWLRPQHGYIGTNQVIACCMKMVGTVTPLTKAIAYMPAGLAYAYCTDKTVYACCMKIVGTVNTTDTGNSTHASKTNMCILY